MAKDAGAEYIKKSLVVLVAFCTWIVFQGVNGGLRLIPSFSKAVYAFATLFLKSASFALVCDFELCVKFTISCVVSSIFNDFTC